MVPATTIVVVTMPEGGPAERGGSSDGLSDEELHDYVEDVMDWTAYQAQAYVAVVQHGPIESSEIVALTEVPQGRVYDVMTQLEGKAVNVIDYEPPKLYKAQPPRMLIEEKREDFTDKADSASHHLQQQHEIQLESAKTRHPAWVIPDIAGTKRALIEAIDEAEDSVCLLEEDGKWIQSDDRERLEEAVSSGIDVEVIGWEGWRDGLETLVDGAGVSGWIAEEVNSSVALIDDELAILRVGRGNTGVKIEGEGSVDVLHTAVKTLKEGATEV